MTEVFDLVRRIGEGGAALAPEILLRVTVLLVVGMLIVLLLRRSSAALRHMVWALSLVGTLLIPPCSWAFPAWRWAVLPQAEQAAPPVAASTGATDRKAIEVPQAQEESRTVPEAFRGSAPPIGERSGPLATQEHAADAAPGTRAKTLATLSSSQRRGAADVVVAGVAGSFLGFGDSCGIPVDGHRCCGGPARCSPCPARDGSALARHLAATG